MRRLLVVGADVPNFPRIEWKDWGASNPLDYQGLLLDCREPLSLPGHSSIAGVLQTLMTNGHPAYILLPEAKNLPTPPGQMLFVPNYFLIAEQAFGQTLKVVPGDPFFESYRKAALTGHEICFRLQQMNNTPSLPIITGITDNVSRPVCCRVGTLYLLHPPLRKLEQKAFKAIIEHFGPEPVPTSNTPKPSWVDQEASVIPGVAALQAVRASISAEIQERTERLNAEEEKLRKLSSWADLLWLEGLPLQNKVGEALELLGLKALSADPTAHAGDLVADGPGVHLVFEVTGSNGTIGIEKGRQLMQWVADAPNPAATKGVLIANAFRNDPPNKRPPTDRRIFVVEVEQLATRYHLALVDVRELYRVLCVRLSGQEVDKTLIINGLMGDGVVRFQV